MPITDITMEMGQFDTQVLKAIEEGKTLPQGVDYQHGERYGVDTLREAVFTRDGYTCQCCGKSIKDGVILRVHHIIYRSNGGTNRMSNLITVCTKCHTSENHKPGGKLYGWKPKIKSFKGATFMTSVRWILYRKVKSMYPGINVHLTYGADTKGRRRERNISKSHVNDAYVMGIFHPKHRAHPIILQKKRRNNRILEKSYDAKYVDSRDGKKKSGQQLFNGRTSRNHDTDTENLHKYRKCKVSNGRRSIRTDRYVIQPHDKILYQGKILEAAGCHCKGTRVMKLLFPSTYPKSLCVSERIPLTTRCPSKTGYVTPVKFRFFIYEIKKAKINKMKIRMNAGVSLFFCFVFSSIFSSHIFGYLMYL